INTIHQEHRQHNVCQILSDPIRNWIESLTCQIARGCNGKVTDQCGPAAAHIPRDRNEYVISNDRYDRTTDGNDRSIVSPVGEFEPYRKIIVNAEEKIGRKQQGHYRQAFPVRFTAKQMLQHIKVDADSQQENTTRDNEVVVDHGKEVTRIFFARVTEKEGLCGKPKCLYHKIHKHGKLVVCTEHTQRVCAASARIKVFGQPFPQCDPRKHFVSRARQPGQHNGKSIDQHSVEKTLVKHGAPPDEHRGEEKQIQCVGQEVYEEHIGNANLRIVIDLEEIKVKSDDHQYIDDPEYGKPHRLLFQTKAGERDSHQGIDGDDACEPYDIVRMIGYIHLRSKRTGKRNEECGDRQRYDGYGGLRHIEHPD